MIALLACSAPPPVTVAGPTVVQPSPFAPYARRLDWSIDHPARVRVFATDGLHRIEREEPSATSFEIPLVGLYADRTWTVTLIATDDRGHELVEGPVQFTTEPLPGPMPNLDLRVHEDGVQPGFTLVPFTAVDVQSWLAAVDEDGQIAWLYDSGAQSALEAQPTDGGVRFLQGNQLVEVDWLGVDRHRLSSIPEQPDLPPGILVEGGLNFNHEFSITPQGTWLAIGVEDANFESFPLDYDDPTIVGTNVPVAADEVLELDPATGAVLSRWSSIGHLDPGRIGYGSLNASYLGLDWTHANAIGVRGDERLISIRHLDAVLLVDAPSGDVQYILGNHDNWSPEFQPYLLTPVGAPFEWQWHQHATKLLDDDKVLMFDNGNFRASPWTGVEEIQPEESWSRVVEYQVDRQARTVRQLWDFQPDPPLFSGAMGDADLLPNGHVLATFAYVSHEGHVSNVDLGRKVHSIRVIEFDPETSHVYWDLDAWSPDSEPGIPGWQSFRSERIAGF